jgi:hypothetical protein
VTERARVRAAIYRLTLASGLVPQADAVAAELGIGVDVVRQILAELADTHAITLAPSTTNIWMAHPFSAVPTAFPVHTVSARAPAITYWANCAWDAFGIAALLDVDVVVDTQCATSAEPVRIRVAGGDHGDDDVANNARLEAPADAVVHFLVQPRYFYENVGFT